MERERVEIYQFFCLFDNFSQVDSNGVRWILDDNNEWVPAVPDDFGAEEVAIPDYLECLKEKRKQEKEEDEMIAAGKIPPRLAAIEAKEEKKRKRAKQKNTGVLIKGFPLDQEIDVEDFADYVSKFAGVIKKNPETRRRIVKLKTDEEGKFNGSVLVVFFKPESVKQAINLLTGMEYISGHPMTVEAHKREKKKEGGQKKKDKRVKLYDQEKELAWEEEEEQLHVIVTGVFTLNEANEGGFEFFDELKGELLEEFEKLGKVKNLKIFEHNPLGVVAVKYEKPKGALRCVERMNGRFFAGRQLESFFYDGFTDYDVKETEAQREKRIKEFGEWLGAKESEEKNQ